jgi:hypothetical protein
MKSSPGSLPFRAVWLGLLLVLLDLAGLPAQEKLPLPKTIDGTPSKLDEALSQLKLFPNDAFLQYVVLQLGRREGRGEQMAKEVERLVRPNPFSGSEGHRTDSEKSLLGPGPTSGASATLTFLPDGLHAIIVMDRRP